MSLIRAEDVSICRGETVVLQGISLAIEAGEIVTLLGPNGSGKSTLIKALIGALPISAGEISHSPGLRLGYVPQKLSIDQTLPLTVRRFLSLPKRVDDHSALTALRRTGIEELAQRQLAALSGGQLQRALLARALLSQPQILLLDEPTQGLDQPGEAAFYRLIEELRRETGVAILMVSHDLHVVMAASDRVICLNGHICCQGTPRAVSSAPEYRALFGLGTQGALALYRHEHDHSHDHPHDHTHDHPREHSHDHGHSGAARAEAAVKPNPDTEPHQHQHHDHHHA